MVVAVSSSSECTRLFVLSPLLECDQWRMRVLQLDGSMSEARGWVREFGPTVFQSYLFLTSSVLEAFELGQRRSTSNPDGSVDGGPQLVFFLSVLSFLFLSFFCVLYVDALFQIAFMPYGLSQLPDLSLATLSVCTRLRPCVNEINIVSVEL